METEPNKLGAAVIEDERDPRESLAFLINQTPDMARVTTIAIAEDTVRTHCARIHQKLHVSSRRASFIDVAARADMSDHNGVSAAVVEINDAQIPMAHPVISRPLASHWLDARLGARIPRQLLQFRLQPGLGARLHPFDVARGAPMHDQCGHAYSFASGRNASDLPRRQSARAARRSDRALSSRSKPSASAISQNSFHGMIASLGVPCSSTTIFLFNLITTSDYCSNGGRPTRNSQPYHPLRGIPKNSKTCQHRCAFVETEPNKLRVAVVEDQADCRDSLAFLINQAPDMACVAAVASERDPGREQFYLDNSANRRLRASMRATKTAPSSVPQASSLPSGLKVRTPLRAPHRVVVGMA